uniref:Cation transport regulator ChaB n=1 Tax=Acrobeloides nanus TaxID=290746 RepID=A0A914BXT8_9BILA
MPYKTDSDLPEKVKDHLPKHGQHIYREAFNNAYEQYQDPTKRRDSKEEPEKVVHKVAWAAVKNKYEKGEGGQWYEK